MKKDILKRIGLLISANGISLIFPFLFAPILSRIYSPEEFGVYAMFTTVVSLTSLVASFRFEFILYKYSFTKHVLKIFHLAKIVLISFVLITLIVCVIIYLISSISIWYLLVPISVFFSSYIQLNLVLANVFEKYRLISFNAVLRSVLINVLMLIFGVVNSSFVYLILGFISTQFIQVLVLYFSLKNRTNTASISYNQSLFLLKKHFKEVLHSVFSTISNSLSIQLPLFYMKKYFSYSDVGNYFQSDRLVTVPVKTISRSLSTIYVKEISKIKDDQVKVVSMTNDFIKKMILIGVLPFSLIFIYGQELFLIILGDKWIDTGLFAMILAPFVYLNFLVIPLTNLFEIYNLQKKFTLFNISLLLLRAVALFVGVYFNSLILGVKLFSIVSLFNYLFMFIYLLSYIGANVFKVLMFSIGSFLTISSVLFLFKDIIL